MKRLKIPKPDNSIKERLLAHTLEITEKGCWISSYAERGNGYPGFGIGKDMYLVHRIAWEVFKGPIPSGMNVLHTCDERKCFNPEHLFIGTQAENNEDCLKKGRARRLRGEHHPMAKVSMEDVKKIRLDNRILREIAEDYGICFQEVWNIKNKVSWRGL